jgi:hypothetical protein
VLRRTQYTRFLGPLPSCYRGRYRS